MNDLIFTFNTIMPILMLILLGHILRRVHLLNNAYLNVSNNLTFKVLLPVLLFSNVLTADFKEAFQPQILLFSLASVLVIYLIAVLVVPVFSKNNKRIPIYIISIFRSNVLLFGIPLAEIMFGTEGAAITAVFIAFYVPFVNVLTVVTLNKYNEKESVNYKNSIMAIIKNPLIIAGVLGIIGSLLFTSTNFSLPYFIDKTLIDIKSIAAPIAFIALGADIRLKSLFQNSKLVLIVTLLRLIIIPLLVVLVGYYFGFRGLEIIILITTFATPIAVSTYVIAYKANADYKLVGEMIGTTTVFSIFTIFIFVYVAKLLELL